MPVRIEGYEPPRDNRMERLVVSPDPGVIEVNIHPSKNWKELVHNTDTLYEQAFLSRLGTEKFMLDGRHTGTGGGNHITIGGSTPSDSPLLRRPDLLRSLIAFWQHHPGFPICSPARLLVQPARRRVLMKDGKKNYMKWRLHSARFLKKVLFLSIWLTEFSGICLQISPAIHTALNFVSINYILPILLPDD